MHIHLGIENLLPWTLYLGMWVAFGVSALWRPSVGLYVLAFALPMQTGRYKIHGFFMGSQFVDLLMLGVVLGLLHHGEQLFHSLRANRILLVSAVFLYLSLWQGAFFTDAPLPYWISDPRFSNWKNYTEMFFLAALVGSTISTRKQVALLIAFMCLSVLVVNRNYYSLLSDRDLSRFSYDVRDPGLLGYAGVNGFAAFEAIFCSFLLGLLAFKQKLSVRFGLLIVFCTGIYCLLFAFSRGGYVGILCGMLTVGLMKSKKLLLVVVFIVFSWQTLLPISVQERISMTTGGSSGGELDHSSAERITLWRDAIGMFERNPVTGTGFDTYEFMGRVGDYKDTHNYFIKVLAETGIVGFGIFLLLLKNLFSSGWQLYRLAEDPFWSALAVGFTAATVCAIVLNFFGDRWTYQQVDGYLWILLGVVFRGLIVHQAKPEAVTEDEFASKLQLAAA